MCGILFTSNQNISVKDFETALLLQKHRGPDYNAVYSYKNMKLGHVRLSIIDLDKRSNQPFISDDERFVIVFNGEIYNYVELKKKYKIQTKTQSDTEVLLKLYLLLKESMLEKLNGMFAFVIYDKLKNKIFAARDRLGIKPLYYTYLNSSLYISSEMSSILKLTNRSELDNIGLRQYKKLRTFMGGRTLYKGIHFFPAGHYLKDDKFHRYWDLPSPEVDNIDKDNLRDLLSSSIKYRMRSDVSLGCFLSGGFDSTLITKLARVDHSWTVGFEDNNEFYWGKLASSDIEVRQHEVIIKYEEFKSRAQNLIEKRLEPLSVPNEVLIDKMSNDAKKSVTVLLSGEGADELFWGYDRIFNWALREKWDLSKFSEYYSYGSNDDLEIVEEALAPHLRQSKSPIEVVCRFFLIEHLHGLLRRLDNSTMFNSIEARVPFLDHRLVDYICSISYKVKRKNFLGKSFLKDAFKDFVPKEIVERKKIGFPVPLKNIFGKDANYDSWLKFNLDILEKREEAR